MRGHRARLLLLIHGTGGGVLMALALLLPAKYNTGPSTLTLYQLADRHVWAVLWGVLALLCWIAASRPKFVHSTLAMLAGATVMWALGLAWPLFADGRTNLLAVVPWTTIAVAVVGVGLAFGRE